MKTARRSIACPAATAQRPQPSILKGSIISRFLPRRWPAGKLLIGAAAAFVLAAGARGDSLGLDFSTPAAPFSMNQSGTYGWSFNVTKPISIDGLGVLAGGLVPGALITIWTANGNLVDQFNFSPASITPVISQSGQVWIFNSIPSRIVLQPGAYVVAEFVSSSSPASGVGVNSVSTAPGVVYGAPYVSLGNHPTFPSPFTIPGATDGLFGPNFLLSPTAYWLGTTNSSWSGANWTSDQAGTTPTTTPDATVDVFFSTNNATGALKNTTLPTSLEIHSLTNQDFAGVTINGPGMLTISGASGFTGIIDNGAALTINANLTLAGGSQTIAVNTLSSSAGAIINGVIGGSIGMDKEGVGTLVLNGANVYTGGTTLGGGTVGIGNNSAFSSGAVTVAAAGASIYASGSSRVVSNAFTLNGVLSVVDDPNGAQPLTLSGALSGAGGLAMNGTLTFFLSGANTYGGGTTVNSGGTFTSGNSIISGAGSTASITSGATGVGLLTVNGGSLTLQSNLAVAGLSGSGGNVEAFLANETLTIVTNATAQTYSGVIGDGPGAPLYHLSVVVTGNGTQTFAGANTYTGGTTISAGTLKVGNATALGGSSGAVSVASGAVLDLNGTTMTATNALTLNGTGIANGGALTNSSATAGTYAGLVTLGSASSIVASGGSIILSNTGTITGSGFGLTLGGSATGNSLASIIGTGAGTLNVSGGTWTLSGSSTYTGVTTVSGGVLSVGSLANGGVASNIGAASNAAGNLVLSGGTLQYTGASVAIDRGFTASNNSVIDVSTFGQTLTMSGAVNVNGGGSGGSGLTIMGNLTLTGTVSLDNSPNTNNALDIAKGGTLTTSGTVTNPTGNNVLQGGALIVAGGTFTTNTITALGNASAVLGSTMTVSGGVFNQTGGQFLLGQAAASTLNLNGGTFETAVQLQSSVTGNALNFNGGTLQLSANLTNLVNTPADVTMTVKSGGALIDVNGHTLTISNALLAGGGAGGLTLGSTAGGGTLTLSGASTYTGATDIQGGTLQVNGSLGNTASVTVESGATLGGTGTISSAVTVMSGGILAPGDAPGTLTVGSLALNSGSNTNYQLGTPGVIGSGVNDLTVVTGALTLGGTLNITSTGSFGPGAYQLFQYNTLTNNGLAIGTVPATYSASNFILVTGVPKEVDLIIVPNGPATAQFWDGATTTGNNTIHGGSGTWSNFTTNFTNSTGSTNAAWENGIAVFMTPSGGPGASTVTLSGAINFAGLMFTGNGYTIVSNGAAGTSFTALGTPTNSTNIADISTSTGVTATIDAIIGGSAGISKSGIGTLILNGVNTYSGGTTIKLGILSIGNSSALSTGPVSISGGGELNGAATMAFSNEVTFAALGNSTVSAAAGMTFSLSAVDLTGGNAVFGSAVLGGAQNTGVVAIGSLITDIVAAGSTIEVARGTLQNAGGAVNLGNLTTLAASTTVDMFGTLDVHDNSMEVTSLQGSGHVTLGSNAATVLTVDAGSFSGMISGAGQLNSTGTLALTGGNTYTGGTTIASGTLTLGDGSTTGSALGTNTVTINGLATLVLDIANGETFANSVIDNGHVVAEGAGVTITGGGGTLSLVPSSGPINNPFTISSVISGLGDFTMNGANVVTDLANTYHGGTFINSGVVRLQLGDGVTAGAALGTNTVTISSGAGIELDLAKGETFSNAVVNNGYFITYGASNNYTISGPISGMGGFYQFGNNIVTLTGNNSYQGGTVVSSGTLLVNNAAGSGTGNGAVTVYGGTLGGSGTIAGAVTLNAGGVIAPGAGSPGVAGTKLSAASLTWNGGGTISLQLGPTSNDQLALTGALTKGAGIGGYTLNISTAGMTLSDYTLATFASTTFVASDFTLALPAGYSGALVETSDSLDLLLAFAATGPVIQNSNPVGTPMIADFTVTGPVVTGTSTQSNTINSLIFTPGGTLTIFNTLTLTSGKVTDGGGMTSITGGTLSGPNGLIFNLIGEMVVDSQLQGNLTKIGTGSLILNGALFGNAQVLAGLLGGTGSISGNLYNNGTVAPGDAPGTLSVAGNYTQTHTASLVIGIGGRQAGQFDVLAVGGKANLDGTLQLVQLNNFTLQRGEVIPFLTAGQGITGTFSTIIDPLVTNTILQPEVVYGPNGVSLVAEQGSFKTFAQNSRLAPNEIAVGGALDSLVSDPRANALINYLDSRTLNKLSGDLVKIDPEQLTSMFTVGVALANVQSLNLQRRTDDIRSGSSGFSAAGFAMNGASPGYSGGFEVAGPAGLDGKESKEAKEAAPVDQRWGAFLSGTGQWVNVGDTNNARGYNIDSGGFTLGVDYKVSEHFAVGLSFGYTGSTSDLADRGRIFVNGGKMGVYSTTYFGGWYADAAVNGGYNSYATRRTGLEGQASGSPDGGELNAVLGTGYDFKKGALTFGPTATFNYTYVGLDDFSEHGSLAPLNIHGSDEESLRTALGFRVKYDWKVGGVLIKPELRAAWQHEFGDTAYSLDSSFGDGAGSAFTVSGPKIGRDSALLSGGFAVQCNERSSFYVYYDGELGRANFHSSSVSGGFRVEF